MLWEVDIYPAPGQPDLLGRPIATAAAELGLAADLKVAAARGYLIQADWDRCQAERVALELLTDRIVETAIVAPVGDEELNRMPRREDSGAGRAETGDRRVSASPVPAPCIPSLVHVLPKPGVMDPVAQSVMSAIEDFGLKAEVVRTLKKYWIEGLDSDRVGTLERKGPGQRRHRAGDRRPLGLPSSGTGRRRTTSA